MSGLALYILQVKKKQKNNGVGERIARPLTLGFTLYAADCTYLRLRLPLLCPSSALPLPCLLLLLPSLAMALGGHNWFPWACIDPAVVAVVARQAVR